MPVPTLTGFIRRLAVAEEADDALVQRFVDTRSEAAFEELVRRYGAMVFGVCRRALGDHHLAEDAFQAVFVVLARKAHAIRPPGAVGGWLYGVARKAAAEAAAMRRRKHRETLPGTLPERPADAPEPDDSAAWVDAEIAELPDTLRSAVLLCEIEGVSRADAAVRLGIAQGTLSSRLARARKVLGKALRRRGMAPMVAAAVTLPRALANAAARRVDGRASGTILELSNGVLRTMLLTTLKLTPVVILCLVLAIGTGLAVAPETPRLSLPVPRRTLAIAPVPERQPEWKAVFTLEHTHRVAAVAASKDLIVAAADVGPVPIAEYVRFWNVSDGKASDLKITRGGFNAPVRFNFLRFTTDDTYLIMGSEHLGMRYRRRPGGIASDGLSGYDLMACSADMNTLLVQRPDWQGDRLLQPNRLFLHVNPWVIDANFMKESAVIQLPDGIAVTHAAVSADGHRFSVAGDDAVVRVYDRESLKVLHKLQLPKKTKVKAVRLSDDGKLLAVVGEAGFARVFDTATGTELCELKGRHEGTVSAVAFAPDGKRVATASGKVARVFDSKTGKLSGTLAGHTDGVTAVAFSSDGKRIVTGSADKTAKVWELKE